MERKENIREFVKYAFLNVLGMIGLSCYILADTFFIANGLGANGLTALNLAIPIFSFVNGCGLMLGMGGATKYSILRGQKAGGLSNRLFTNTLLMGAGLSVCFMAAGLTLSGPIAALMGADADVFDMTAIYLKVILLFSPAFIFNNILLCFVRNDGNPKLSMMAMLIGSLSNILLDYIFIFPLQMGIFGAVLATGFAPLVGMTILSIHLFKKKNCFHLTRTSLKPSLIKTIISLGFPSLITEVSSGIVIIAFNAILLSLLGNVGVAAYGIIANLSLVVIAVYNGVAQGMQPLASSAFGRGDRAGVRQFFRCAVITAAVLSCAVVAGVYLFASQVTSAFNSQQNAQLQEIAVSGLKLYFTAAFFVGFNIVLSTYFTSTDQALPAHCISLLRGLILIVPIAFALSTLAGVTGVWLSFPITEGLVAALGFVIYVKRRPASAGKQNQS